MSFNTDNSNKEDGMKRTIFLTGMIVAFLMAAIAFSAQPVMAADQAELVPMELDGTTWAIKTIVSVGKNGEKVTEEDTLLFKDKKFLSANYETKGYTATNYSLTVSEDDVTSFGTMQIKDKETTFWKGEIADGKINGSIHVQYPSGKNETRYFTGELSNGALNRKDETKPVVQVPEEPIVAQPVVPEVIVPEVKEAPIPPVVEDMEKIAPEEPQVPESK
jgi:hypothetical protein